MAYIAAHRDDGVEVARVEIPNSYAEVVQSAFGGTVPVAALRFLQFLVRRETRLEILRILKDRQAAIHQAALNADLAAIEADFEAKFPQPS